MPFNGQTISAATLGSFVGSVFTDTFSVGFSEVDMIALDLVAGTRYVVDVDNGTAGDFYLRIFDQFGNEVRGLDDGFRANDNVVLNESPYLEFSANYTGRYYVAISPWYLDAYDPFVTTGRSSGENPLSSTAGTLRVEALTNDWPSAGSIGGILTESFADLTDVLADADRSVRAEMNANIDSLTDVDLARIDLVKGDRLVIDVNGALGGTALGTVLRAFSAAGAALGFDDDGGFGEDPEFVFNAPSTGSFYFGISGEGNSAYSAVDGTGTVSAVATGAYQVIVHRNPTQIGTASSNLFNGDETANYFVGLGGNDTVNGNAGRDTLAGGDDQDSMAGGDQNDVLYGEHGNDTLLGDKGSDVLSGGLGNDSLDGGVGADLLAGGAGDDTLRGGAGSSNDTLSGDTGNDSLSGFNGNDSLSGGAGVDTLAGERGNDTLFGGTEGDSLSGGNDSDVLHGDDGNDTLGGDAGSDTLFGGNGDDSLTGGSSTDRLDGGAGNDTLTGNGDDVFVFSALANGIDTITDFSSASAAEFIDLSAIFAATGSVVNAANLSQFIQVTAAGAGLDSFLAVDADGFVGGSSFTTLALVQGNTALQLFDAANFIL